MNFHPKIFLLPSLRMLGILGKEKYLEGSNEKGGGKQCGNVVRI